MGEEAMAADQEEFHRERERDRIESTEQRKKTMETLRGVNWGTGARDEKEPEQREDRKSKGSHWREDGQVWVVPEKRVEVEQASLEVRLHQTEQGTRRSARRELATVAARAATRARTARRKVATGATSAAAESGG